jgi:hypothetical protein
MASIINASTSAGIVQTADTSGILQLQSNGTQVATLSNGSNTSVGAQALNSNTASNNTAVGYQAGYSNTTGTRQVHIGYQAGYATTGSTNVFVGGLAGTAVTSGAGNTFVGDASGVNVTTGSYNTILGAYNGNQNGLNITTSSNYIVLSDGNGNPRGIFDGSGRFLFNTTSSLLGSAGAQFVGNSTFTNAVLAQSYNGNNAFLCTNQSGTAQYNAFQFCNNGTTFSGTGSISISGSSTAYNTSSDYRLKENVQPMTGALDTVAQLKPVTYDWIVDKSKGQGFIAHELQAVVPDCVTGEKDAVDAEGKPVYQGIDTSFLVATLTAAIQEQQALITTLQTQVAALQAKVGA